MNGRQRIMEQTLNFITEYFWQIFSLTLPCLAGFTVTQVWKVSVTPKPEAFEIYMACAAVTAALSTLAWLNIGYPIQAITVGITTGLLWPFAVLVWFAIASRFAPKAAERLKGSNGEVTILPWVQRKK